ncbi:MAG: carbohydrate binding domain-containing protein, partial [Lentisphaeria bacterium]|nr:carbohydrate binding domain-containing protein [Lentisphaeria bacterium]
MNLNPGSSFLFLAVSFALAAGAGPAPGDKEAPIFQTLRDYDPASHVAVDYGRVGENRFLNSDLEQAGEDGALADWETVGNTTMTTEDMHSGQHALLLKNPIWPKRDGRLVQDINHVQGGVSYQASIYMRSPKGSRNVNIKFEVYTPEGKSLGGFRSEHFTISDSEGWVRVAFTHKLPPVPEVRVTVLFRLWDAGPLLLDDASFTLVRQEPLYLAPDAPGQRLMQVDGLLAWTKPLPTRIPAQYPVDAKKARAWPSGHLELQLAGNETGILPLFLTATGSDLADVSVQVETRDPEAVERCDLALYTVEAFQYLGDLYYDVLVPAVPFALPSGTSKMVWLSVYMPPGAKRQPLQGALLLRAKGREAVRIPFSANVFKFDLPHEPSLPFSVG